MMRIQQDLGHYEGHQEVRPEPVHSDMLLLALITLGASRAFSNIPMRSPTLSLIRRLVALYQGTPHEQLR
jgi:hypothetical protein